MRLFCPGKRGFGACSFARALLWYDTCVSIADLIFWVLIIFMVRPSFDPFAPTELQELLPGIINELGSENLDNLKEIAGNFGGAEAAAGDDDDDVPDLVENFEDASK